MPICILLPPLAGKEGARSGTEESGCRHYADACLEASQCSLGSFAEGERLVACRSGTGAGNCKSPIVEELLQQQHVRPLRSDSQIPLKQPLVRRRLRRRILRRTARLPRIPIRTARPWQQPGIIAGTARNGRLLRIARRRRRRPSHRRRRNGPPCCRGKRRCRRRARR